MTTEVLTTGAFLVLGLFVWDLWDRRRGTGDGNDERDEELGLRLIKYSGVGLVTLALALVLDGLGVPGAVVIAAGAIIALLLVVYVMPTAWYLVPFVRRFRSRRRS